MSEGTIGLIFIALFVVVLLFGFLFGLWRGMNKSLVRLLLVVASMVGAFFLAPLITKWALTFDLSNFGIRIGSSTEPVANLGELLKALLQQIPYIAELEGPALERILTVVPQMIVNVVLFVVVFYLIRLVSMIIYWIIAGIAFSKKKTEGKNKHRFIGSLVGVVQSFGVFLVLLVPVAGIVNIMGTVETIVSESEQTEQTAETASTTLDERDYVVLNTAELSDGEQESSLTDSSSATDEIMKYYNTVNDVIRIYKNTWVAKFISSVKLDTVCQGVFDKLSTIEYKGEKFELKEQVQSAAKMYTDLKLLQEYDANKLAEEDLRTWLAEKYAEEDLRTWLADSEEYTEKQINSLVKYAIEGKIKTDETTDQKAAREKYQAYLVAYKSSGSENIHKADIDALVDYAIAGTEETGETADQQAARKKYAELVEKYNSDKIKLKYKVLVAQKILNHAYEGKLIAVTIDEIIPQVAAKLLLEPSDPDYGPVFGIYLDDILSSVDDSYKEVVKRLLLEVATTNKSLQPVLHSTTDMVASLLEASYKIEKATASISEATLSGDTVQAAKDLLNTLGESEEIIDLAKDALLNEVEEGQKNNLEKIADEIFGDGESQVKDVLVEVVTSVLGSEKYETGEADIKTELAVVGSALDLADKLTNVEEGDTEAVKEAVQDTIEEVIESLSESTVILETLADESSALKEIINEYVGDAESVEGYEDVKDWISQAIAGLEDQTNAETLYSIFGIEPPAGE